MTGRGNFALPFASSLWRHLAETHLRDDWRFLARFLGQPSDGARDAWLRWFDRLLQLPLPPRPQDLDAWASGYRWFMLPDDVDRIGPVGPAVQVEVLSFDANLLHLRFSGTLG